MARGKDERFNQKRSNFVRNILGSGGRSTPDTHSAPVFRDPMAGGGPGPGPVRRDPKNAPGDFDEFMSKEGRSYMKPAPAVSTPYQQTPQWDRGGAVSPNPNRDTNSIAWQKKR